MRTEPWKLIFIGGILTIVSLLLPAHMGGVISDSYSDDNYYWILGFILKFRNGSLYRAYWFVNPTFLILLIWNIGSLISGSLILIFSSFLILYAVDIKKRGIVMKKYTQIFNVLLFLTASYSVIFTSFWAIPVYGSLSLITGTVLIMIGMRKIRVIDLSNKEFKTEGKK